MVPEAHATRVHHPIIRVTQAPLPKSSSLFPGRGHITKNHVYRSSITFRLLSFGHASARFVCGDPSRAIRVGSLLQVNVAHLCMVQLVLRQRFLIFTSYQRLLLQWPSTGGIGEKSLHLSSNVRREEVALNR